uniref:Mitochondrial peptide methionine sulfoxide reductase n=1 Tax=Equus caballus TaxID=9796 RepID=F6TN55_HORSE
MSVATEQLNLSQREHRWLYLAFFSLAYDLGSGGSDICTGKIGRVCIHLKGSIKSGMGCFWGAERKFWTLKGVYSTQVGFAGGYTPNPTYKEVCSGKTGHAEVVRVVYQPERISFEELLKVFWENHDPTQGMRQGNDYGSQYRSAIYPTSADHMEAALRSKEDYQKVLSEHGYGLITTDIREGQTFYYAEDYHQQYLSKNPDGYCGLGGTGVSCPLGIKK